MTAGSGNGRESKLAARPSAHRRFLAFLTLLAGLPAFLACGRGGDAGRKELRVGYFANITHSQAIVGREKGLFERKTGLPISYRVFNAGPTEMEALLAGELDLAYVGPNPAINAYLRSHKAALRVIAGATSGGASLVVRRQAGISALTDIRGKTVASPELGNTQDIALRVWLKNQGLTPGADVRVTPVKNPEILMLFRQGSLDAAWVPEPWATRLCQEADGVILLDETSLWPEGRFTTAVLVARAAFLKDCPERVKSFLEAHVEATRFVSEKPAEAVDVICQGLQRVLQKALKKEILTEALTRMQATWDPVASSMKTSAQHADELGYLPKGANAADVVGLFDLNLLNEVLKGLRLPPVQP